jgi:hypothetical protein
MADTPTSVEAQDPAYRQAAFFIHPANTFCPYKSQHEEEDG